MPTEKRVWLCDVCGLEHIFRWGALECEARHRETEDEKIDADCK